MSKIYQCPHTNTYYDPLAVRRALLRASAGAFNRALSDWKGEEEPARSTAEGVLVKAAREAFTLPPVDPKTGQGIPDEDALAILTTFTKWLKGKDSKAQTTPTTVPCTECPQ